MGESSYDEFREILKGKTMTSKTEIKNKRY